MRRTIGMTIRAARLHRGYSQRELALIIGTKRPYISKIENGRAMPDIESLIRIADGLNMEAWKLLRHALKQETQRLPSADIACATP